MYQLVSYQVESDDMLQEMIDKQFGIYLSVQNKRVEIFDVGHKVNILDILGALDYMLSFNDGADAEYALEKRKFKHHVISEELAFGEQIKLYGYAPIRHSHMVYQDCFATMDIDEDGNFLNFGKEYFIADLVDLIIGSEYAKNNDYEERNYALNDFEIDERERVSLSELSDEEQEKFDTLKNLQKFKDRNRN